MSPHALTRVLTLIALGALAFGCKTTETHDRAATTADHVVAVGGTAGQTQVQLDRAADALDDIVAKAAVDPTSAFKTFRTALEGFSDSFAKLKGERAALGESATLWFSEFQKNNNAIQDMELRKLGEERMADLQSKIGDVQKQVDELLANTTAVEVRMNNLRTFLGNDLTQAGIKTVAGRVSDTTKDARKAAGGLGRLSKSSEAAAEKMRAARPPPPPAK